MEKRDLLIIGGGCAGMAAAVAAYDSGIKDIIIVERAPILGGILNRCIHNGFGLTEFKEELTGPEFLSRFAKQVVERNIKVANLATVIDVNKDRIVKYIDKEGIHVVSCGAIIMAAGCYERNAGAIGIPGSRPAGVLTAGQAQMLINNCGYMVGKRVFILGSGDIGLIMARRMTLEGAKVLGVAELMPYSNGLNRNIVQCLKDFDIPLYLSHTVTKIIGKEKLEAIEISKVDEKLKPIAGTEMRFECDTLLLSIGLIPDNTLLKQAGATISKTKGCLVDDSLMTSIPGIFSCGNVLHVHDLVDFVAIEAREAGRNAANYIKNGLKKAEYVDVVPGEGIGYVVPGKIDMSDTSGTVTFKFRVKQPVKDHYIIYKRGSIKRKIFKMAMIPSEMIMDSFPKNLLDGDVGPIEIYLVKKEGK